MTPPTADQAALIKDAIALLECLAIEDCWPVYSLEFLLAAAALATTPIGVADCGTALGVTLADSTNPDGTGNYTNDLGNTIATNSGKYCPMAGGGVGYNSSGSRDSAVAQMAGVLGHELLHADDEYTWDGNGPATGDESDHARAEVESAEFERVILLAILDCPLCIVLDPAEASEIRDRLRNVTNFRDKYQNIADEN